MTPSTINLFDTALALPAHQRAELAGKLLESLQDASEQEAIDEAWADEALSRLKAYDEGKMGGIRHEELMRTLRQGCKL